MQNEPKASILVVDDDKLIRRVNKMSVESLLERITPSESIEDTIEVKTADSIRDAIDIMRKYVVHVILLDKELGKDDEGYIVDGIAHIHEFLEIQPSVQILVITGHNDTRLAVKSMRYGAFGYIVKGIDEDSLKYRDAQILLALERAQIEVKRAREILSDTGTTQKKLCPTCSNSLNPNVLAKIKKYDAFLSNQKNL